MNQENKLGVMPIGKLLAVMSIPMMISFFIQALYNVVDSIFVAMLSENALTAVSIAFPMQNVIIAIGVGTGVAVNALVPRYLGQQRQRDAEKIANVAVFLSFCYCLIFVAVGLLLVGPYYRMQTDVDEIVEGGIEYLTIVCVVSAGAFFGQNFEKLLVATGNTFASMASQATGAIFNIIFDPLLIFGVGPFPAMGIRGAAAATVLGQIVAAVVAFILVRTRQKSVRIHFGAMPPDGRSLKEIYSVAVPSIITVGIGSVMSFCLNQILLAFSTTATAVFGIWLKLQNFSYMPVFGLNNGATPMLAYNYGAGRMDRVHRTTHLALGVALGLMGVLVLFFESFPGLILTLFSASEQMASIGTVALRITCASLPFGAVVLILSSSFQALGRSRYTLLVNLCRQLFFMVPIAWALSRTGRLELVWLAVVIAEAMSAALAVLLRRKMKRDLAREEGMENSEV